MYKKRWIITIMICCFLTVSTSCSGDNISVDETTLDTTESSYTINVSDERDLSFYFMTYRHTDEYYREVFAPIIEELEMKASHLMVNIKFNWIDHETYLTDIQKLISSGYDIDAFSYFGASPVIRDPDFDGALIMDITDIFPEYAPRLYNSLGRSTREGYSVSYDGRIYAIPNNYSYNTMHKSCIIARKDLVEKSGMTGITSLDEYNSFLRWVKENEPHMIPGCIHDCNALIINHLLGNGYYYGNNAYIYYKWEDEIPVAYPLERLDPFIDLLGIFKQWTEEELIYTRIPSNDLWSVGLCASMLISIYNIRDLLSTSSSSFEYDLYPLYPDAKLREREGSSRVTMISAYSPEADRVLMFFDWLYFNSEAYDLLMYGIEGVNYKVKGTRVYSESGMTSVIDWEGSETFRNYLLDKPSMFEPEGYSEMVYECVYKNAAETPLDKVYDIIYSTIPEDERYEYTEVVYVDQMSDYLTEYREYVYNNVINKIREGEPLNPVDMICEEMSAAGGDIIAGKYNEWIEKVLSYEKR